MSQIDLRSCQHDWVALGVRWRSDGRLRPGSGATTIEYYDTFHCRHCCEIKTFHIRGVSHDSYAPKLPGTMPLGEGR